MKFEIKKWLKERDEVLLSGDIDQMVAFYKKHSPDRFIPASRDVLEHSMHLAITGAKSLPLEYRQKSKQWLTSRNYLSMDEGDL